MGWCPGPNSPDCSARRFCEHWLQRDTESSACSCRFVRKLASVPADVSGELPEPRHEPRRPAQRGKTPSGQAYLLSTGLPPQPFHPPRFWSKTRPRAGATRRRGRRTRSKRALFLCPFRGVCLSPKGEGVTNPESRCKLSFGFWIPGPPLARRPGMTTRSCTEPDAQTYRHQVDPDHRRRAHRHRPSLRIRLFRHAGLQGAEGRGLPGRAGEFEPGDDHDRSRSRRRDLYRADHAGDRREDHREGTPRRAAADHGRADRAQLRAVAQEAGRARQVRRRDDRRHRRGDRQGRRPRAVPRGDDQDRARHAALASCARRSQAR